MAGATRQVGPRAAAYVCVGIALFVSGCARNTAPDPIQVPVVAGSSDSPGPRQPPSPPRPSSPPPSQPAPVAIPDGKNAGILTKVDLRAGTVTFDPVVVLTGAAMKQYLKSHPDAADPYYSPAYIIVNDSTKLRTLPLAATATVAVIDLDSGDNATHPIRLGDLPAHLKTSGYHEQDGRSAFPYYLTVSQGRVTALQELGVA